MNFLPQSSYAHTKGLSPVYKSTYLISCGVAYMDSEMWFKVTRFLEVAQTDHERAEKRFFKAPTALYFIVTLRHFNSLLGYMGKNLFARR